MSRVRAPFTLMLASLCILSFANSDAAETPARKYQLQVGVGFAAPYNLEEPFLNMAQMRSGDWSFETGPKERVDGMEAVARGFIDAKTRMPTAKAGAAKFGENASFYSGAEAFRSYYADEFVLSWKGDARGYMQRWEGAVPSTREKNRVVYSLSEPKVKGGVLRFGAINSDVSDVKIYRKKYEALVERGEIWNPEFIKYVRRYDVARTMDLQYSNNLPVRRFDQIATMSDPWGQRANMAWPEPPFYSVPYEVLFNLGVKADIAVWMTLPLQIGSPVAQADPSLRRDDKRSRLDGAKFRAAVSTRAKEALASPEWDIFAKEFVDRYLASGYPMTRPLYLEAGNEVWNNAGGFWISTNYALAIAQGTPVKADAGHGYGVLVARYVIALEKEFARRKISPNVVYIIGARTADSWRTQQALEGFIAYLKLNGANPNAYLPKTGVAVTNYYGHFNDMSQILFGAKNPAEYAPKWIGEIKRDPTGFSKRISTLLTDGPKGLKADLPWLLVRYAEHKAIAEKFGSRLIGAYEGGSHLVPPRELSNDPVFRKWWRDYHWGEEGAAVGRRFNQAIIDAYPDFILSNYRIFGPLSPDSPWVDGHYAEATPVMRMWDEFARPDRIH